METRLLKNLTLCVCRWRPRQLIAPSPLPIRPTVPSTSPRWWARVLLMSLPLPGKEVRRHILNLFPFCKFIPLKSLDLWGFFHLQDNTAWLICPPLPVLMCWFVPIALLMFVQENRKRLLKVLGCSALRTLVALDWGLVPHLRFCSYFQISAVFHSFIVFTFSCFKNVLLFKTKHLLVVWL